MMFCSRHGRQNCIVCFDRMAGIPRNIAPVPRLHPRMTRKEMICSAIVGVALAAIAACLVGCTPVAIQSLDLASIGPNTLVVADVRACTGLFLCWPWVAIHKETIVTDANGHANVFPESSNGNNLSDLADPMSKAIGSFSWGLSF